MQQLKLIVDTHQALGGRAGHAKSQFVSPGLYYIPQWYCCHSFSSALLSLGRSERGHIVSWHKGMKNRRSAHSSAPAALFAHEASLEKTGAPSTSLQAQQC